MTDKLTACKLEFDTLKLASDIYGPCVGKIVGQFQRAAGTNNVALINKDGSFMNESHIQDARTEVAIIKNVSRASRPQSRRLESQTAGLQSLWLASRLKPWLGTIDGLRWLMAANHGL